MWREKKYLLFVSAALWQLAALWCAGIRCRIAMDAASENERFARRGENGRAGRVAIEWIVDLRCFFSSV